MSIFLRSEGCDDPGKTLPCGRAFMKVNNQGYSLHARGVNVVVFSAGGIYVCNVFLLLTASTNPSVNWFSWSCLRVVQILFIAMLISILFVHTNGVLSEKASLKYGVPQGSILRPLLYFLYIYKRY